MSLARNSFYKFCSNMLNFLKTQIKQLLNSSRYCNRVQDFFPVNNFVHRISASRRSHSLEHLLFRGFPLHSQVAFLMALLSSFRSKAEKKFSDLNIFCTFYGFRHNFVGLFARCFILETFLLVFLLLFGFSLEKRL